MRAIRAKPGKASPARSSRSGKVKRGGVEKLPERSWKARLVVSVVVFHFVAILVAAAPVDGPPLDTLRRLLGPYLLCTGLVQAWDTFAPNPKSTEQFLEAIVTTRSGKTEVYSFPRMEELSLLERYRKERYRKFVESILCGDCYGLWPDMERTVARRMADASDPPVKVRLVKYESPIDPGTGAIGEDAQAQQTTLSEISVGPEDLR